MSDQAGNPKLVSDGHAEDSEPSILHAQNDRIFQVGRDLGRRVVQPPAQSKVCCEIRGQL